jgi:hypothetical protein
MAVTVRKRAQAEFVIADCLVANAVGDMVRVYADEVAGVYQVRELDILSNDWHLPVGMITRKLTSTRCAVQVGGEVKGIYTGLTPGKQLFINSASRLQHTVPTHPAVGVTWAHPAALALSSGTVLLRIQVPVKMQAY